MRGLRSPRGCGGQEAALSLGRRALNPRVWIGPRAPPRRRRYRLGEGPFSGPRSHLGAGVGLGSALTGHAPSLPPPPRVCGSRVLAMPPAVPCSPSRGLLPRFRLHPHKPHPYLGLSLREPGPHLHSAGGRTLSISGQAPAPPRFLAPPRLRPVIPGELLGPAPGPHGPAPGSPSRPRPQPSCWLT